MRSHLFLPIAAPLLVILVAVNGATNTGNICYNIDGSVDSDSYRCDNSTTGHTTCCQAGAICYSNGVCQVINNGVEDFQRVGCTDKTWADPSCLKRCGKYAPGSSAGIRPCDGILEGNHYCCDNGSNGIGSYECCKNASSTFILGKSLPTVLAQMPLSQLSTTASTSATSSATSMSTSATMPTPTGDNNDNNDDGGSSNSTTVGLGVGLGVGIPVAAVIAGGIFFFMWRSRRKNAAAPPSTYYDGTSSYGGGGMSQAYSPGQGSYAQPYPGAPVPGSDAGHSGWSTSPSQGMTDAQSAQGGLLHKYGHAGHSPTAQESAMYQPASELPTSPNRPSELPS